MESSMEKNGRVVKERDALSRLKTLAKTLNGDSSKWLDEVLNDVRQGDVIDTLRGVATGARKVVENSQDAYERVLSNLSDLKSRD
jgi:hypothetical protein